ncbi:MAG: sensor histidine kinase, partial [Bacteroidota bacterium]
AIRVAERHERTDDLQFDLRERSPGIEEQWLEVATAELVDNACKFSETETPVIVQSRLDDGAWMLSVFNRGHGFPAAAAERTGAFLQFHRDDSEHGGLGLGLAMVKIIAALYGGTVEIDEKVGTTTVGVRLPLH